MLYRREKMLKRGQPKIEVNLDDFIKLCEMQCTRNEMTSFFDCEGSALDSWIKEHFNCNYTEIFERFRGKGLLSLRRSQFQLSERNVIMAIWLGKQYLGQKDVMVFNNQNMAEDDALTKSIKATMKLDKPTLDADDVEEPK